MPVFIAPLGGLKLHYGEKHTDQSYNSILIPAAKEYGVCAMAGDGMDKAGVYFGVPSFSKADVEALRNNVDWEDETSVKMYQTVLAAEETTEKAETELANLTKAFQRRLNRGFKDQNEANKWIDSQLESSDYSTLAKMDASLKSGKIKAMATDFPTSEQLQLDNVVATPHLGAGTPEADENCAVMAARQIMDYLENGNITNSVNLPDVSFPRTDGSRITIIHQNRPGMLGAITETVSNQGINIENLVNRSRGNVAYTMLDFIGEVPSELPDLLAAREGIMRVRLL